MNDAGGDLKEIKRAVNDVSAHLMAQDHSRGSVLTTYPDDEKAIWKEFRRELIEDGFSSSVIREHKDLIKAYVKELGSRGLSDDEIPFEPTQQGYCTNPVPPDSSKQPKPFVHWCNTIGCTDVLANTISRRRRRNRITGFRHTA